MKKSILLLMNFIFLFGISLVFTQETSSTEIRGDTWQKADYSYKRGYVKGVYHCAVEAINRLPKVLRDNKVSTEQFRSILNDMIDRLHYWGTSTSQVIEGLDGLYRDYLNRNIPVHHLMMVVCKEANGLLSPEEVEKELHRLRSEARKKE